MAYKPRIYNIKYSGKNCFNVMALQERYKKNMFVPTMFYHEIMCKKVVQLQFTTEWGRLHGIKSI